MNKKDTNDYSWAVIFDMDGVIVNSNNAHRQAVEQLGQRFGKEISQETYKRQIFGRPNSEWIPEIFHIHPYQVDTLSDLKEDIFRQIYENDIKPLDGLIPLLKKLKKINIPMAIASSAPESNINFILGKTKLLNYFDKILTVKTGEKGKPDPQIYINAALALERDTKSCIVFEDSEVGILAAHNAGCKVIAVATTFEPKELKRLKPDSIIGDFREIGIKELCELAGKRNDV